MFKKHMTPLTKGGSTTVHQGKGSQQAPFPNRREISGLAGGNGSINDYAKASPAAQPQANPVMPGPGSGGWPGNGM
jgi:hypothetical protein